MNAWLSELSNAPGTKAKKKKFYAFKEALGMILDKCVHIDSERVLICHLPQTGGEGPLTLVRIDEIDYSFHQIPSKFSNIPIRNDVEWNGNRLKPVAPLVLARARERRDSRRSR